MQLFPSGALTLTVVNRRRFSLELGCLRGVPVQTDVENQLRGLTYIYDGDSGSKRNTKNIIFGHNDFNGKFLRPSLR